MQLNLRVYPFTIMLPADGTHAPTRFDEVFLVPARVWIDVEDLFEYARSNLRPSGIQRLAFEIYRELQEGYGDSGRVYFVRNTHRAHAFNVVQWSEISELFAGLSSPLSGSRALPPPVGIPPISSARQLVRRLAYRLPPPIRGTLVDVRITQARAFHLWGKLIKLSVQEALMALLRFARRLRSVHVRPEVSGYNGAAPADEFARLSAPGDTLLVLGSPWSHPDYAAVLRQQRVRGVRVALLVYDLIPLRRPEWCDQGLVRSFRKWFDSVFPLCDDLFTISRSTAYDVESYVRERGIPLTKRIVTIPVGTGFKIDAAAADLPPSQLLPPAGSYALIVSTIEARKNHMLLFRIWRRMLEELPRDQIPTLVFAGHIGWLVDDLMRQIGSTNNLDGKLVVVENPSDADLVTLYRGCLFTMFPSFYEGWGLPVTESLALGKPCFISNRTSLPEAGGSLVRAFDPDNLHNAYAMIRAVLDDREDLARWESQVREDFKPLPWSASANAILVALGHSPTGVDT